ncbi:MAG: trypsin-like serine protease [Myxococcales bacterium]|nr:trypsin-like serine protease [Myxococcales bacterium]
MKPRAPLALAPLVVLLAACSPEDTSRRSLAIAGGQVAASGAYAAVVGIAIADELDPKSLSLLCSGTLIAPDAVLTAAHCLIGSPPRLRIFIGSNVNDGAAGTIYEVVREQMHPLWSETSAPPQGVGQANDLALLFVSGPVQGVDPVALPASGELASELVVRTQTTIVGYGAAMVGGASGIKQVADGARLSHVGDFELAVSYPGEPQACEGDSGGPALLPLASGGLRIVGVASRASGSGNACNGGAVYTRVDSYIDFIVDAVPNACIGATCAGSGGNADGGASTIDTTPSTAVPPGGTGAVLPPKPSGCAVGSAADDRSAAAALLLLLGVTLRSRTRRNQRRHRAQ